MSNDFLTGNNLEVLCPDFYRGLRDIIHGDICISGEIHAIGEVGVQAFAGYKNRRLAGAKYFGLNFVGFKIVADFVTRPDLFIPLDEYLAFGEGRPEDRQIEWVWELSVCLGRQGTKQQ